MNIAVVTGNPKPASRTQGAALSVADAVAAALPRSGARLVVDLAEHAPGLFDASDAELSRLTAEVAAAMSPSSRRRPTRRPSPAC